MIFKKGFASDNNSGVDAEIMKAIFAVNEGHTLGYGDDTITVDARNRFKQEFGEGSEVFFMFNGTGANTVALSTLVSSYHSVICSDIAHIYCDECGAPAKFGGFHITSVKSVNGKVTPEAIRSHLHNLGIQHHSQPGTVSITQPTEIGTLYSVDEIKAITSLAHQYGLTVHMDGARLSNAAVALDLPFRAFTVDAGIDAISFGGTKNGMLFGEAVILFNHPSPEIVRYIRKQSTQLYSKMRFISAQFLAYFENERWKKNAANANNMAQLLAKELSKIKEVRLTQKTEANGVFISIPSDAIEKLLEKYDFFLWNESINEIRLLTSFDTTEDDIHLFIKTLKRLL